MEQQDTTKGKEKETEDTTEKIICLPKGKREFNAALFGETIQKGFAKVIHNTTYVAWILLFYTLRTFLSFSKIKA